MRTLFGGMCIVLAGAFLSGCETMDTGVEAPATSTVIVVEGTLFYPDETGTTYRVPSGAQVVGAGGTDCVFIVEDGGSVTAHSGVRNSYRVERGGHFRGFAHPATECTVTFESGAIIEQEQTGPGTRFVSS